MNTIVDKKLPTNLKKNLFHGIKEELILKKQDKNYLNLIMITLKCKINILFILLCATMWGLNMFDGISTYLFIQNGYEELNPYVNWFITRIGVIKTMLFIKTPFLLIFTFLTIWVVKNKLTKREMVFLGFGLTFLIIVYSYCMFNYNLPVLLNIYKGL